MKINTFKKSLLSLLSMAMVAAAWTPASAQESIDLTKLKSEAKDYWDFESERPFQSNKGTEATKHGNVEVVSHDVMGKTLHFGAGTDNYMRLDNYMNTGVNAATFSMWYRYDSSLDQGDEVSKSAVLLQHEQDGKSILTLKPDGKLHTYLNAKDVVSDKATLKNDWEHVAVTFDQNAKKVYFYINGQLDSTKDLGTSVVNKTLPLRLGAHKQDKSNDPHPMRGDVDEFYVFEKALKAEEVNALYEEKAKELYFIDLTALIEASEALLASGAVPSEEAVSKALEAAITAAKASKNENLAAMKSAYETLEKAKNDYRNYTPIVLTIDPTKVIQNVDVDSIFGINHRYAFNGYGTFDSNTMKINDDFKKLYEEAGFGSIRYPGGTISNLFNWKTTLGDPSQRKKQIHGFYNNAGQGGIAPNFGIKEIGDFADSVGSEIAYVYSLGRGNVQDAEDLVEFLNAKVGTNPNGGVDWAKLRADLGRKEPYNVRYFEIGNEMQQAWTGDGTTSQGYWTLYVDGGTEKAYTEGGTMKVTKMYTVDEENWNEVASQTTGKPNLVRHLRYANLNPGKLDEKTGKIVADPNFIAMEKDVKVYVGTRENNVEWQVVDNFENSKPTDKHVVVDYALGTITFGDGVHGKIPDAGQLVLASYQVKRDGFLAISEAIKNTTAKINELEKGQHEANVYSSYETVGFINRMKNLGKNDLYDGLTIHPYSGTPTENQGNDAFYDSAMKKAEDTGVGNVTLLLSQMPEGKVPVISEYGIFRSTNPLVRSQTHALYIAKVMMEYVKLGSPYIQKHCLSDWYSSGGDSLGPTQQAVIQVVPQEGANTTTGEGNFKYFSTPSARVYEMMNRGFGEDILEATFQKDQPLLNNGVKALNSLVGKDKQGNYYIALVNVDREKDYNIQLNVEGVDLSGRKIEVQRLEADSIAAENTLEQPDNVAVKTTTMDMPKNQVISVQKHSVVLVKVLAEEVIVDRTALNEAMEKAEKYNEEDYTADSYQALKDALAKAKALSQDATQEEVDACKDALERAMKGLVLNPSVDVDFSALEKVLKEAKAIDRTLYTKESLRVLDDAMKQAEALGKDATQEEVDACKDALERAMKGLVLNPSVDVDFSALEKVLKEAKAIDRTLYTKESLRVLDDAMKQAEALGKDATQEDVDAATKAVKAALDSLQSLEPSPQTVDKSALISLVEKAEAVKAEAYTKDSYAKLVDALQSAKAIISNEDVTQAQVEDMVSVLTAALNGLEKVPSKTPETGDATSITGFMMMALLAVSGMYASKRLKREDE